MTGNTRSAALGAIRAAEEKIKAIPEVLTVGVVVKVAQALFAICVALRCVVEHVDAIE